MVIKKFEDIDVWKASRRLVNMIYDLTQKNSFKRDFGLREQIQKAAVSCMSNVAEGFDSDTKQQFIQMLSYTKRSASEVQSELYAALDRSYIDKREFGESYSHAESVRKLANGFIRYLRTRQPANPQTRSPETRSPETRSPANPLTRKLITCLLAVGIWLLASQASFANNVVVENIALVDKDAVVGDTYDVRFDIAWENSWFISGAPSAAANWDAAWVFAKFSKSTDSGATWSAWQHCTLLNTGNTVPAGSQMSFGLTGSAPVGAFIYRASAGAGSVDWNSAEVRWAYGTNGVLDTDIVKIKVFAIEMVYIPQGAFYVGSGGTETSAFYKYPTTTNAYLISSEAAINVGAVTDYLYYPLSTYGGDQAGPIPLEFPKGYNAFYMMKYEVSQGQYKDFLNTLTRAQQNARTGTTVTTDAIANVYVMSNSATVSNRQGIRCPASGNGTVNPITFGCDLNANGVFNEADDGENIACNYVSWADICAYADWAGLRPFTELEYGKACRGSGQSPVANEYAWGTAANVTTFLSLYRSGYVDEGPSTNAGVDVNADCNLNYSTCLPDGPIRCGAFAGATTTRGQSGASYYGVMELSGNLWERPVTVGHATGRLFTGVNGDGALTSAGDANTDYWPGTNALGSGSRGGSWIDATTYSRVSDRAHAAYVSTVRYGSLGGRACRTSP